MYFDEPERGVRADVIRYLQRSSPLPGARCVPFATMVIDLRKSVDEILAGMNQSTRRSIRLAERGDGLRYSSSRGEDAALLNEVFRLQDKFAARKGLSKTDRPYLTLLARAGALDLSLVRDTDGSPLSWHIYYRDQTRVRAMHGGCVPRAASDLNGQRLGRANRFDLWLDLLRFRDEGIEIMDLGGWYTGISDEQKLRINLFKQGFGGSVRHEFNCLRAGSRWGAFALRVKDGIDAWRASGRRGRSHGSGITPGLDPA